MKGNEQVGKQQKENWQEGQERLTRGWILNVNWLRKIPWITGTIIYGWIFFATLTGYSYQEFNWEKSPNFVSWITFAGVLLVLAAVIFIFPFNKENSENKKNNFLEKTLWGILPVFYLLISVAILTLTLMTYQFEWREARQGVATIFASMFAAVGVVISMVVSYQNGAEARALDNQKHDAELIESLNERLHQIIPRRQGADQGERIASYYQLAALYKDWENFAISSELVENRRKEQQKYILKIFFGSIHGGLAERDSEVYIYQNSLEKNFCGSGKFCIPWNRQKPIFYRSNWENKTINSISRDIFDEVEEDGKGKLGWKTESVESGYSHKNLIWHFDWLDFSNINLLRRDLRLARFAEANLSGAHLYCVDLGGSNLRGANLDGAHLGRASLKNTRMVKCSLRGAKLWLTDLAGADLFDANLEEVIFYGREKAEMQDSETRNYIVKQLSLADNLDKAKNIELAAGFDQELVAQIKARYKEVQEQKRKNLG
ncbi:pentapeptide repeat-containing protein [Rothia sp. P5766]|uniref:pentapeptide repeat-containing protein n=1 Tax=Rothia sp. P5766 TaxID=3402656 RepID=UPI003ADD6D86